MRRLLPNISPTVLAQSTLNFGYAMLDLAALSFLGLGVQPPTPDWGAMINESRGAVLAGQPLSALAPAVAIIIVVVAFNIVGESSPTGRGARPDALLEIDHLSLRLPGRAERPMLDDVDSRSRPARRSGLVGESGSGKSMTARAIARLLPAGASRRARPLRRCRRRTASRGELRAPLARSSMVFQDPRAHINPVRRIGDFMTEACARTAP